MKRKATENFLCLIFAWVVYGLCQLDFVTPLIAFIIILPSYVMQISGFMPKKSVLPVSFRMAVSIAMVIALLVRSFFLPEPDTAMSFFPVILPTLQTASIIISVFVWYQFAFSNRTYILNILSWATVAFSIDVPFNSLSQLAFWTFCFVSVGFTVGEIYFPASAAGEKIRGHKHGSLFVYSYPFFLALMSGVMFFFVIQGIKFGDQLFAELLSNYMIKNRFHFFDSALWLNGSYTGTSSVRPIMEIDSGGLNDIYLRGQVFEQYAQGVWRAEPYSGRLLVSDDINSYGERFDLTMFEYIDGVIPVPATLAAIKSKKTSFYKGVNDVVYSADKKIPRATFVVGSKPLVFSVDEETFRRFTQLPAFLNSELKTRTDAIVGNEKRPFETAVLIETYFRKNFDYSLSVDFFADDEGLLYMLDNKKPAYCSYFASAMVLMLRQYGIPARVVAGFLATEKHKNNFIVRPRDAHAWVEVLLPYAKVEDGGAYYSRKGLYRWVRFDPTPSGSRQDAIDKDVKLNKVADWIWCTQKRIKAVILDIEPKTLVFILFVLIAVAVIEEVFKILWTRFRRRKKGAHDCFTDTVRQSPYIEFYMQVGDFIKNRFDMEIRPFEADGEFIKRLKARKDIPVQDLTAIEMFVEKYHNARFGFKKEHGLRKSVSSCFTVSRGQKPNVKFGFIFSKKRLS